MSFDPERMTNTLWPLDANLADQTVRVEPAYLGGPQMWNVRYLPDAVQIGQITNPEPGVFRSWLRTWDTSYFVVQRPLDHGDFDEAVQRVLDGWTDPSRLKS